MMHTPTKSIQWWEDVMEEIDKLIKEVKEASMAPVRGYLKDILVRVATEETDSESTTSSSSDDAPVEFKIAPLRHRKQDGPSGRRPPSQNRRGGGARPKVIEDEGEVVNLNVADTSRNRSRQGKRANFGDSDIVGKPATRVSMFPA